MDEQTIRPLPADPRRQAHRTIGAYGYQIWQSVYAWLMLADDETLFLEGAEDFDIVSPENAIATQVKDSPRSITLRSAHIQNAIADAWRLLRNAQARPVQYRFLTRADITVESGNPFGRGVAGLNLWRNVRAHVETVRTLVRFLVGLTDLPSDLRLFLKSATDQEIVEGFLCKIHWDTASPQVEFVEAAVEQQLALLGEKLRVPHPDAVAAKNHLFTVVCGVAKQPAGRFLTRADLLSNFAEATHVTMPYSEAAGLREVTRLIAPLLSRIEGATATALTFSDALPLATQLPPLPSSTLDRPDLGARLGDILRRTNSLVLHGSTGMGKTTLAKLLIASSATKAQWVSLTGTSTAETRRLILHVTRLLPAVDSPLVIFDDVDFSPTNAHELEPALGGFIFQLKDRGGTVILTSLRPPPSRLLIGSGIEPDAVVNVPPLTRDEIVRFLDRLGCPRHSNPPAWAALCRIETRGHPQLVHAYLLNLRERGWPLLDTPALAEPSTAVAEEQTQARQLLTTRSDSARDLLFGVSVIGAAFRRDHALALAVSLPGILRPGEEFDNLVGPWIEQIGSGYYRVSALIDKAGDAIFNPERLKDIRIAIIAALRSCRPVSLLEAATDFRQSWLARSEPDLIAIVVSLLSAPRHAFTSIAPRVDWFALEGLSRQQVLWKSRRELSRTLRLLQFRLAAETMPDILPAIFASWHFEVHGEGAAAHAVEKCMLAAHALTQPKIPLSPVRVFEYLRDIHSVETGEQQFAEMLVNTRRALPRRLAANADDMVGVLMRVVGSRFSTPETFEEMLTALETYAADLRQSVLNAWEQVRFDLHTLVDGVWLGMLKKETRDWQRCLATYDRAFHLGGLWNAPHLSIAAIRASALVTDEYLHEGDRALALLEERARIQNIASPFLDDSRATIHFNHRRDEEALACWTRALAHWPETPETEDRAASFAARLAGRAAARLGQWEEAAHLFIDAQKRVKTRRAKEYVAGLVADAAFAFWRAGDKARSLDCLASALRLAVTLPDGKDNLLAFRTRKLLGSIIVWIHNKERGHEPDLMPEPQPGMCSELETHPGFRDLPENQLELLWLFLGRIECTLNFDSGIHEELVPKIAASTSPVMPVYREEYFILRALQRADLACLPKLAWDFTQTITREWEACSDGPCPWEGDANELASKEFRVTDPHVGAGVFFAAVLVAAARGNSLPDLFQNWRESALEVPGGAALGRWLTGVEAALNTPQPGTAILNDGVSNWIDVFVVALSVITSRRAAATDLAFAQFRIIDSLANTPWLLSCAEALATLFSAGWQRAILLPATLSVPNLSIPAIREAIASPATGVAKAVAVLLAGIKAVRLKVSPALLGRLQIIQSGKLYALRHSGSP